jgi:TonB family protein
MDRDAGPGTPQVSTMSMETANDRFKKTSESWFWGSMIAAVVIHAAVFTLFPEMRTTDWASGDETGAVLETRLAESSGHAALDQAAQEVAKVMRFTPATNLDRNVAVWVRLKVQFKPIG